MVVAQPDAGCCRQAAVSLIVGGCSHPGPACVHPPRLSSAVAPATHRPLSSSSSSKGSPCRCSMSSSNPAVAMAAAGGVAVDLEGSLLLFPCAR